MDREHPLVSPGIDPPTFLRGGGAMGEKMRTKDWSEHALGAPATWPQALRLAVRIMLDSRYQMWMAWGPDKIFFCNDAYVPTLGVKETWALGAPASVVWAEIWPDIGPSIERVYTLGESTWEEGLMLLLERSGFAEETFHTFSYSPLPDDAGGIGGMLCVVTEETERVINDRRLAMMRDAGALLAGAETEAAVLTAVDAVLSKDRRDVPFALMFMFDAVDGRPKRVLASGVDASYEGVLEPDGWPIRDALTDLAPHVVYGLQNRFDALPTGHWSIPPSCALMVPIARRGSDEVAGVVIAAINPYRPLDADFKAFLALLVGQSSAALASAQAYEQERERVLALAELDRAKTAFFSNVSHEFRTPLTLMLGPLEEVVVDENLPEAARAELMRVRRNGMRLLKLVNTLLDFSRIEAGRAEAQFQATDLARLTVELASAFQSASERAGLQFAVEVEDSIGPVYVDVEMWEKIVLNLVSNAFKYTVSGSVNVRLQRVAEQVMLEVIDTGIGIPVEAQSRLFERFFRVPGARGRTHEGTGIGLALVSELVQMNGGTITVESTEDIGSAFRVFLPLGHAHLDAAQILPTNLNPLAADTSATFVSEALGWIGKDAAGDAADFGTTFADANGIHTTGGTILLVDDNNDMRDYVRRILEPHFRVLSAGDGHEALEMIIESPPDLVLSDVMMPRLDGFGLLGAIRASQRLRTLPVVLLSARAGEDARIEGLRAGADDYLIKPFSARELLARVSSQLQIARLRSEAGAEVQASNNRLALILDSVGDAFFAIDAEARITTFNARAERYFGLQRQAVTGKPLINVFPEMYAPRFAEHLERAQRARIPERFEAAAWSGSGWIEVDVAPFADGLSFFVRDISDRKAAEEALHDADRKKDDFLALLAHELRNPMAPLSNALHLLKVSGLQGPLQQKAYDVMSRQLAHMVRLVDDLLDVSRITSGKMVMKKEITTLQRIVESAIDTARPLIDQRHHTLTVMQTPEPLQVNADPVRVAQVVANLLGNSAKFTSDGGQITLTVSRDGETDMALIEVADNGIGIAKAAIGGIFNMFNQADESLAGPSAGLGIGLALVKGLTEMHGGSVSAHSDGLQRGTRMQVRLPLDHSGALESATAESPESAAPTERFRVLVVDDNADAADSLAALLEILGHDVAIARDGEEAVEQASQFLPQLIFMDIGMPRMNGLEAGKRIRELGLASLPKLVALTGWGQHSDRLRSQEAGFDHHLVKPIEFEALEAALAMVSDH